MKKRSQPISRNLGAAALLLASLGCAATSQPTREDTYVSAGLAYGHESFDLDAAEEESGLDLSANGTLGADLRVGRRVHPLVELELQGQFYDGFEIEVPGSSTAEVDVGALTLNAKLYNDLSERWFPYLLLGLGAMQADLEDSQGFLSDFDTTDTAGRAGLGLEACASGSLFWFVEGTALVPFDDLDGLTVYALTGGVQWRF